MKLNSLGTCAVLIAAATATAALTAGCSSKVSDDSPAAANSPSTPSAVTSLPPDSLLVKMKSEIDKGHGFAVQDATDLGRTVDLQHADLWKFCLSRKGRGPNSVDLGAVPRGEKCPDDWNAHVPTPKTPNITGMDFERAYMTLLRKGYDSRYIGVFKGSKTSPVAPKSVPGVHGKVCEQSPKAGSPLVAPGKVRLLVGTC